jgi:hypothetical protein
LVNWSFGFGRPFAFDKTEVGNDLIETKNNLIITIFLVSITALLT